MARSLSASLAILCILSLHGAKSASAQGGPLVELYGEGVHRYFAGDMMGADEILTRAIDSGSQDPRVFFYRGLVREAQGGAGQADFDQGAQLEAQGKIVVAVGKALTRIQGYTRSKIEKARRDARIVAQQQKMMEEQERMKNAPATPPAAPAPAGDPTDPLPMRSDTTTEDAVQPAVPEVDATTDPFADDPAPAPAGDSSPFGGDATPAADPFGGSSTPATPEPASDPFADPFGN